MNMGSEGFRGTFILELNAMCFGVSGSCVFPDPFTPGALSPDTLGLLAGYFETERFIYRFPSCLEVV